MSNSQARLRMLAGPNGSGKSTLKNLLTGKLLGTFLNADDLEAELRQRGQVDLAGLGITSNTAEIRRFFAAAPLLQKAGMTDLSARLDVSDGWLSVPALDVNSYVASVLVEFLRLRLLEQKRSFTFETVMSHPSKVEFLEQARAAGYRTYLYFIATDDPEINVSRVRNRVALGGHAVPEDRIVERYHRSLELLWRAIRRSHRAYLFDNSGDAEGPAWIAEVTEGNGGRKLEFKSSEVPEWVHTYVLNPIYRRQ